MKRYTTAVCVVILVGILLGCGPSALQIQAEMSYYEAQAAIQKKQSTAPIFMLIATDASKPIILENVAKIEVYAPPAPQNGPLLPQYQHKDYSEPFWRFMGTAAMVAAPIASAGIVLHEASKFIGGGSNYYTNNVGQNATGNFRVQGNTTSTSSGAGASTATGMTDQTSTPTVVNPVVVEQPAPVVITQPEPIIVK